MQGTKGQNGVLAINIARSIDLSNLNSGVYIVSMKNTEGVVYKVKVIKNYIKIKNEKTIIYSLVADVCFGNGIFANHTAA